MLKTLKPLAYVNDNAEYKGPTTGTPSMKWLLSVTVHLLVESGDLLCANKPAAKTGLVAKLFATTLTATSYKAAVDSKTGHPEAETVKGVLLKAKAVRRQSEGIV